MRYLSVLMILVALIMTFALSANAQVRAGQEELDIIETIETGESLRQEQAELQEEYENIMESKADAGDPPGPYADDEDFEAYEQKVEEINRRIEDYTERLEDLEKRIKEYNERLEE